MDGFSIVFLTRFLTPIPTFGLSPQTRPVGSRWARLYALTNGAQEAWNFRASADGKRLTYMSLARSSDVVYLGNLELGAKTFNPQRLTLDEWDSQPSDWTRDSKAVLFYSIRSGRFAILKQRIDQQTPEILLSGAENYQKPTFSPAGDRVLYTASATPDRPDPSNRLMSMPVDGGTSSSSSRGRLYLPLRFCAIGSLCFG